MLSVFLSVCNFVRLASHLKFNIYMLVNSMLFIYFCIRIYSMSMTYIYWILVEGIDVATKGLSVTEWCLWCFRIWKFSCIQYMNIHTCWLVNANCIWMKRCYLWVCTCCDICHTQLTTSCYSYNLIWFAFLVFLIHISKVWMSKFNSWVMYFIELCYNCYSRLLMDCYYNLQYT